MNVARCIRRVTAVLTTTLAVSSGLHGQYTVGVARLVAEPARVTMKAGETVSLKITAYDSAGKVMADAPLRVGGPRESVRYADRYPQQVVLAEFVRSSHHPVGIGKVVKASELHMDHIVHEMEEALEGGVNWW